jgi:non-heme Fe2+,alpha-ketoglutarate-dependent halogenase
MPKVLTEEQIESYRENGFLAPMEGIDPSEAAAMLEDLDAFEAANGISAGQLQIKGHLCFRRSYDFTFNERILDVVEDLIGPNILAFASRFWIKGAQDGSFVSWHQDSAYFGLDPHELVTVWLAITDSTPDMGCMKVIPGSHRGAAYEHEETFAEDNLLARGQVIRGIDDSNAMYLPLKQGQFSCHHERILHASDPNDTDTTRIGLALFFIPTHVKSTIGRRTACLVRGVDDCGYWDDDPVPQDRFDDDIIAHIRAAGERYVDPKYRQEAEAGA